jgi:hypothetical protein
MWLLTADSTLNKAGAGAGFYIMAWLPLAIIIIFAVRGIRQRKKKEQ